MAVFTALADPTRRRILELLARNDRSVGEIVRRFAMSQPAISRHLRVLREAGLVSRRSDGTRRLYRLEPRGLNELETWVDRRRREWQRRLDALEHHLEDGSERKE
jgi:DNA-binding transcriptional ArsR family regulator